MKKPPELGEAQRGFPLTITSAQATDTIEHIIMSAVKPDNRSQMRDAVTEQYRTRV
uniref:Uncharacterized protein n=1 Tax=viral metagenome TaxID=1070528 RepID=A0A6H1ZB01_9ZZZZ